MGRCSETSAALAPPRAVLTCCRAACHFSGEATPAYRPSSNWSAVWSEELGGIGR
ncbi:CxxxxCH/CxxCH domain-containing protein [Pigmentiphaga sp.]|uniref:CxxxxCH/CxxCH domain-containing protein n=1 Tax=Pigmentiphaga sp. TaxID=1977564 RepID=UPI003448CFA3